MPRKITIVETYNRDTDYDAPLLVPIKWPEPKVPKQPRATKSLTKPAVINSSTKKAKDAKSSDKTHKG